MKYPIIATILAVFGGGFGLHRFYLRGLGAGLFRLAFVILAVIIRSPQLFLFLWLVGFFEAWQINSVSRQTFDERYNQKRGGKQQDRSGEAKTRTKPRPNGFFSPAAGALRRGQRKFQDHDLRGALADFLEAHRLNPHYPETHFRLACTYALLEKADQAFYHLDQAVGLGWKETERISNEDSLAYLRIQPQYQAFREAGFRLQTTPALEAASDNSLLESLRHLSELRQRGDISESDFQREKERLLR